MAVQKYVTDGSLYIWSMLRIIIGYVFLWAFLDKTFGFGVATCANKAVGCSAAWVHGGSPTSGFLGHATTGPFADFYQKLAGHMWVDWTFMLVLLIVGLGLLLGTWVRLAAAVGIAMLLMMWSSLLWPANTPGVDEHIIYALVLFGIALTSDHQPWSLGKWWAKTGPAKSLPFLK